ncbi:hypothetical protein KR084_003608 [Drosophila pseudotakahashii]|nr:hypothetical protein KR084_003608 [Drosophila pseudotakahashii]
MFGVLRRLSLEKLSTGILRWIFYTSRLMGAVGFRFKTTSTDRVMMEDSPLIWKWCFAIIRLGCLSTFIYMYFQVKFIDLTELFLHINRALLQIFCGMSILRLQLYHGEEVTQLVNSFLQLFRRVQAICNRNQNGFVGKYEIIILFYVSLYWIHEEIFLLRLIKPYSDTYHFVFWLADAFISFGSKMLTSIACLWYLSLGVLYSDLNDFVRSQLKTLDLQPTNGKRRKIRKSLYKCLDCHRDLHSLSSKFQNVYDFPFFCGMCESSESVILLAYIVIIRVRFNVFFLYSKTVVEVLNMFFLTCSVQRAVIKSTEIRLLMLNNCTLSEITKWNKTLELFYLQLSVDEFRVRPLGLLNVSKKLFLAFLSTMVCYFTFFIQCKMEEN